MPAGAFRLVVISDPGRGIPAEAEQLSRVLQHDLVLHLRKPKWPEQEVQALVDALPSDQCSRKIVLHSCHEIASQADLRGLHFTEATRPPPPLQRQPGHLTTSTSFHALSQLRQGWGALDYAFLSPVFDSISKRGQKDAVAAFDWSELRAALAACSLPVVALGGVSTSNLAQVAELGFAGAAVLGSVWQAADPAQAAGELVAACQGLHCQHVCLPPHPACRSQVRA